MNWLLFLLALMSTINSGLSIWCYSCVSSHPGCGTEWFDWRYYWSTSCEEESDVCVKIIEQKGSDVLITRDCLSKLEGHRRDIPNDRYDGCRQAVTDPLLGTFIYPSITEIDNTRSHYDNTTFCFCSFDERCNGAKDMRVSASHLAFLLSVTVLTDIVRRMF